MLRSVLLALHGDEGSLGRSGNPINLLGKPCSVATTTKLVARLKGDSGVAVTSRFGTASRPFISGQKHALKWTCTLKPDWEHDQKELMYALYLADGQAKGGRKVQAWSQMLEDKPSYYDVMP